MTSKTCTRSAPWFTLNCDKLVIFSLLLGMRTLNMCVLCGSLVGSLLQQHHDDERVSLQIATAMCQYVVTWQAKGVLLLSSSQAKHNLCTFYTRSLFSNQICERRNNLYTPISGSTSGRSNIVSITTMNPAEKMHKWNMTWSTIKLNNLNFKLVPFPLRTSYCEKSLGRWIFHQINWRQ